MVHSCQSLGSSAEQATLAAGYSSPCPLHGWSTSVREVWSCKTGCTQQDPISTVAVTKSWQEDGELHFAHFQLVHCTLMTSLAKAAVRAVSPYVLHMRNANEFWAYFVLLTLSQVKKPRMKNLACPKKSNKTGEGSGEQVLWEVSEGTGVVKSSGEKGAEGRPYQSLHPPEGRL